MIHYPALFEPDVNKGGFAIAFPDFEWGVTQGETEVEDRYGRGYFGLHQWVDLCVAGLFPGQQIERLLDLQHSSRLEQTEAAFRALNKRLVVSTENAA